jgi:hypothetical protein
MAYIQSSRGEAFLLAYGGTFVGCSLESPTASPVMYTMSPVERVEQLGQNAPSTSTIWLISSSSAVATSITTPVAPTTAASIKSGDVRSLRRNLGTVKLRTDDGHP